MKRYNKRKPKGGGHKPKMRIYKTMFSIFNLHVSQKGTNLSISMTFFHIFDLRYEGSTYLVLIYD